MKSYPLLLTLFALFFMMFLFTCNPKEDEDEETAENDNTTVAAEVIDIGESSPSVAEESIGGMPSLADIDGIQDLSSEDAETSASTLILLTEEMPLDLTKEKDKNTSELVAMEEKQDDQAGSLFQFAVHFGNIFDMVAYAARCNFNLLMFDEKGEKRKLKKLKDKAIYYLDGFGSIGLGDEGVTNCPDRERVYKWAKENGFLSSTKEKKAELVAAKDKKDDNEFYIPSRLVLYKNKDGIIKWNVVFFPKDFIKEIVKRIPHFEKLKDKELDFIAYRGEHAEGGSPGTGTGELNMDWNELNRMQETMDWDEEEDKKSNDNKNEEESQPVGRIFISYDMTGDPTSYKIKFLEDFSFGDGDLPFEKDHFAQVKRSDSTSENYLGFVSKTLGGDEKDKDDGPIQEVGQCNNPNYDTVGGDILIDVPITSIDKSQYLEQKEQSYLQIIWKDTPAGKKEPDEYKVSIIRSGGPFIYGNAEVRAGHIAGATGVGYLKDVPSCSRFTKELMKSVNTIMSTHFGKEVELFDIETGMSNIALSSFGEGATMEFTTTEKIMESFPEFSVFKFLPVDEPENLTSLEQLTIDADKLAPAIVYATAHCNNKLFGDFDSCLEFKDMPTTKLAGYEEGCKKPDGFNGTWADGACSQTNITSKCEGISNDEGVNYTTYWYNTVANGQASSWCSSVSGTYTEIVAEPTASASCHYANNFCFHYKDWPESSLTSIQSSCQGTWTLNTGCDTGTATNTCTGGTFGSNFPYNLDIYFYNNVTSVGSTDYTTACASSHSGTWQ